MIEDQLATIKALVECAFMACQALDDEQQCDALQTVLARADELIRDTQTQLHENGWSMAAERLAA